MQALNRNTRKTDTPYPVKILQFGEGNFLRAFVDWIINTSNKTLGTNYGIVVVQPLAKGMVKVLQTQDNLYHVLLQGIRDGKPIQETELIDCITDSLNPYSEYKKYQDYFLSDDLELVISNTTEAGISKINNEDLNAMPPKSFPGKVTQLLYKRYKHFNGAADKGLTFFACELIEKNALELKRIVLELANENKLSQAFIDWINNSCTFCSTLVDRIVPGFPKDNIKDIQTKLGYADKLVVVGEYFHLWAIEAPEHIRKKYPFDKAGLNIVWLNDMTKFRDKKVRILNGSHTALVPIGLLSSYKTVKEAFEDKNISAFINEMVTDEIIPNIDEDKSSLLKFSDEILERFLNPYIRHFLKDISLNSLSKWTARNYPSLSDCYKKNNKIPQKLSLSLAALIVLYKGEYKGSSFDIQDSLESLNYIQKAWAEKKSYATLTELILSNKYIWNEDLSQFAGLKDSVASFIEIIMEQGIEEAVKSTLK